MSTKICSKCKVEKDLEEFHINKRGKFGRHSVCKVCKNIVGSSHYKENKEKISLQHKAYYQDNIPEAALRSKIWRLENKEGIARKSKIWRQENKEAVAASSKKYYQDNRVPLLQKSKKYKEENREKNREKVRAQQKEYREEHEEEIRAYKKKYREDHKEEERDYYAEHKEEIRAYKKKYDKSQTTSSYYLDKLPPSDKPKMEGGFLTVLCIKCEKRYAPTSLALRNRAGSFQGTVLGENNFYCSTGCKDSCMLFNFQPQSIDPRSELFVEKSDKENTRSCQTDHLKKLQCDEFGYNYCEKCGDIIDVELHHTQAVGENNSISSAGHILLCAGCHVKLHASCS